MVEVCAICDIAGCHHIRSRAAMTDATPTRAEVEALVAHNKALIDRNVALRERAEAAEAECARLKNIRSAIAEGYNAEAVALEKAVSETLTAQLTAARRAEAAAWNDAIEAADKAAIDRQGRRAMGDGHGNSCYDIGVSDAASAIRALRRAAPTEGEAQSLDDTTRAVLDRAERIVAGQSQQEQRTAEIFLRPTEGEA